METPANNSSDPLHADLVKTSENSDVAALSAAEFPLERYEPVAVIGKGTVGTIYHCLDRRLHRKKVAVKVLRSVTDQELVSFHQEARATCRLNHRNIIAIYDFGVTANGVVYMAMEYVEGVSLDREIENNGALDTDRSLKIGIAIADALAYAHSCGIFHRDIKTSNILIVNSDSREPDVRLIDFGVAAIQHSSDDAVEVQGRTIVGTPQYMSPDQCFGLMYDERSEVYSLGCVLFEMMAGKPPFHGESALQIINKHASEKPPALAEANPGRAFDARVEALIFRCLAKNREDRYQSMYNLKADLTRVLDRAESITLDNLAVPKVTAVKHDRDPILSAIMVALVCFVFACWIGYTQAEKLVLRPANSALLGTKRRSDQSALPSLDEYKSSPRFIRTYNYGRLIIEARNGITDRDLKELSGERDLRELRIYGAKLDGSGLRFINSPVLERLALKECEVSNEFLKAVSERKNLKAVELHACKGVTPSGLSCLTSLPLEELSVPICDLDNDSLETVTAFKNLTNLDFSRNGKVDVRTLEKLNEDTQINWLSLSPNQVTYAGMRAIAKIERLKDLQFSGAGKLTAMQLQSLKGLPNLARIVLRSGCASPDGIKQFCDFTPLQRLELNGMAFGDEHLAALDGAKIKQLSLQEMSITSAGLKHLLNMPELQRVTIRRCLNVGNKDINDLSKQMKTCDIVVL